MTDAVTAEDVFARLVALRQALAERIWPTAAAAAARPDDHERIRELVRLKVDIEAIDFTLTHRPVATAP
jgi:hypothetical protein